MARKTTVLSGLFILLLQCAFCDPTWSFDKGVKDNPVIVRKEQNGQEITVKVKTLVQIELAELGSAGYTWHIHEIDVQYLKFIAEETRQPSEEGKIGAPVVHVWRFKAEKAGKTEIKMDYYRPWEGVKKSQDYFLIKIKII
ncbi:MAG: protease inhibitor I42 family protein [Smithella sp.]